MFLGVSYQHHYLYQILDKESYPFVLLCLNQICRLVYHHLSGIMRKPLDIFQLYQVHHHDRPLIRNLKDFSRFYNNEVMKHLDYLFHLSDTRYHLPNCLNAVNHNIHKLNKIILHLRKIDLDFFRDNLSTF